MDGEPCAVELPPASRALLHEAIEVLILVADVGEPEPDLLTVALQGQLGSHSRAGATGEADHVGHVRVRSRRVCGKFLNHVASSNGVFLSSIQRSYCTPQFARKARAIAAPEGG